MINVSILLLAGVILLGVLVILAAIAVILLVQNRNEVTSLPTIPPPQSNQPNQTASTMPDAYGSVYEGADRPVTTSNPEWIQQVQQLAQAGQKIEAIKLFREHTNLGLNEAKDAVEAMEAGQVTTTITTNHFTQKMELTPDVTDQVIQLVQQGRKIEAIKLIREQTNLGLKESKDIADGLEKLHGGGSS